MVSQWLPNQLVQNQPVLKGDFYRSRKKNLLHHKKSSNYHCMRKEGIMFCITVCNTNGDFQVLYGKYIFKNSLSLN